MIKLKLIAYSDAAGKYDPRAPLNGNEDNFYVDDNLGDDIPGRCRMDQPLDLSETGTLMVVADGMGGLNAGEVASGIAIDTVKELFAPGKITPAMAATHTLRRDYMEKVIIEADKRIKAQARNNPDQEGMGSTIIMAWIAGNEMSLVWVGDSRAYRYNPAGGIQLISRDHSYVQDLVDKGLISYEDTFEHPQGNIVTRSLGDPSKTTTPESKLVEIFTGDVILLCSDGLSGVLRDVRTSDEKGVAIPGDNIEDIISANTGSMTKCREALMNAAEKAHWYDNVTILLCQIMSGAPTYSKSIAAKASTISYRPFGKVLVKEPEIPAPRKTAPSSPAANSALPYSTNPSAMATPQPQRAQCVVTTPQAAPQAAPHKRKSPALMIFLVAMIFALIAILIYVMFLSPNKNNDNNQSPVDIETTIEETEITERNLPATSEPREHNTERRQAEPARPKAQERPLKAQPQKGDSKKPVATPATPAKQTPKPAQDAKVSEPGKGSSQGKIGSDENDHKKPDNRPDIKPANARDI
ncbi:MAG: protein phosphatase 2C domain-containing protein [Clostridium sp.]|nr:protein phosphatase 2C domain-containing protein [Prevotella sp.]MCM1428481.1 protein phosphatase 2C domain-containing protein [Clostridium sp.]MCM1475889.1 protein phosphatase 2C domain-containing protein [Muribaculaceae bacterium]